MKLIRLITYGVCIGVALNITALNAQAAKEVRLASADTSGTKLALARKLRNAMVVVGATPLPDRPLPIAAAPSSRPDRETAAALARWSKRYMPTDSLVEIEARAIADQFSEAELRELLTFYTSPLGRKLVEAQPRIARRVRLETSRIMEPHRQELIDTVRSLAGHARTP